jgi:ribonuclease Z
MLSKQITFLGTGAADTTKYYHSCFFIQANDSGLLVDAGGGNGILSQLEKTGIPLESIKHLFVTHKHIDHLFGVFWVLRFLGAKIANEKADGLTIYASNNVIKVIRDISPLFLKEKVTFLFDRKIMFHPIDSEEEFTVGAWTIKPFNLRSEKEEQFGFRLQFGDETNLTCLGDESYKDGLLDYCKNTDYLIHNAFCLERDSERFKPHDMHHSSVKDACEAVVAANAKNLIMIHTEDKATFGSRKQVYTEEARIYYQGKVFVPDDLEVITL